MIWQRTRFTVLAGVVLACTAFAVRADDAKNEDKKEDKKAEKLEAPKGEVHAAPAALPAADGCGGCATSCAPAMKTVYVTECRSETYEATRTVCKTFTKEEKYTAYKEICVPEERTRTCTVYHRVPEERTEWVTKCVEVPTCEDRVVYHHVTKCVQVTEMCRKCVDKGHYECQEVECGPTLWERFQKACKHDCCDTCCEAKHYRTKKVWVPCMVTEEYPVCKTKKITECVPEHVKVNVCKKVMTKEAVKVTCWKCVPENKVEKFTVQVKKCVPFEATRTVCYTAPVVEKYTATRMVPYTVAKQVPACDSGCEATTCCKKRFFNFGW
jgi:hypothetical protein